MYKFLFLTFVGLPALVATGIMANIAHNEAQIRAFVIQSHAMPMPAKGIRIPTRR